MTSSYTTPSLAITWQQPTFLLPLFCLCPLLAASNSLAVAIGLSAVVCAATLLMSLITATLNRYITADLRAFIWLLVSSGIFAVLELLVHAAFYELFRALGIFLPLTIISCLLASRHDMQAHMCNIRQALLRSLQMSAGFVLATIILGAGRELVGHGSLFYDTGLILGSWSQIFYVQLFRADMGFLLAVLAPGAFIGLGIGVALYNWLWLHFVERKQA